MMKELRLLHNADIISDIPDPIFHHIMSFLTTADVTKLSVLSSRFFSLWSSFPVIEFDSNNFAKSFHGDWRSLIDAFLDHIINSILLRRLDSDVLYEFRVTSNLGANISPADTRLAHAISTLLANRVRSMDLDLGFISRYPLPADFASKSIVELRLTGFKIDLCNVIQNCPLLRIVSLASCSILQDIKISTQTLTDIELNCCSVSVVHINAPNLNSFVFRSKVTRQPKPCVINVSECENITYLALHNVVNGQHWIKDLVRGLRNLKTFILHRCEDIQGITVRNQRLERLEICDCRRIASIVLVSKSLESFVFRGIKHRVCNIRFVASVYIKDLSIENTAFTDEWLQDQIAILGCLESLRLKCCDFLNKVSIFHEKLKTFIIDGCQDIEDITVQNHQLERLEICKCPKVASIVLISNSLESFLFKGIENRVCNISFVASVNIKELSIENAAFTDEWLEAQIAILGCLESLRLKCCDFLSKIRIFHEKIKNLELSDCRHLKEADIDTPQLVSFVYYGGIFEFKKIVTRSYCSATLSMKPWVAYNNETFYGWLKLISYFSHCKSLKVICTYREEMMIPEEIRERLVSPLYDLENLEIEIKKLEKIDMELVDNLLWLSPLPTNLQISSGPYSQLQMIIKFEYKDMMKDEEDEDEDLFCCISKPIKCWKHYLKSVEIHSKDASQKNGSNELKKYFSEKAKILDSF